MMSDFRSIEFSGEVVRYERDGFGVVRFDKPIGPSANTLGIISSSSGTVVFDGAGVPYHGDLKAGMLVKGTADPDERDVATVKTVIIQPSETTVIIHPSPRGNPRRGPGQD
jgi:hypothetical protein